MIATCEPLNSGFCLTDPSDERYRYIHSLRQRFGKFLHEASVSLRQQGEENTVDAVQMLVNVEFLVTFRDPVNSIQSSYVQSRPISWNMEIIVTGKQGVPTSCTSV